MMSAVTAEPLPAEQDHSTPAALALRGIGKSFGAGPVLHDVDLAVPAGSVTAVLGPSGCGKTTMLRLIAGFLEPDTGTIALGDRVVAGDGRTTGPQKRHVGYVPQEGALFPHLPVAANVGFGLPRPARRHGARIAELLDLVGLDPALRDRMPHELSGGQQQRVALARALAPAPAVVLLDEPFSSLDAGLREETGHAVVQALREEGATALLVTHDQSEALSLADQVAVMRAGRVVQTGPPAQVYREPADLETAAFLGAAVVLLGTAEGTTVHCALGSLPLAGERHGPVRVMMRPEALLLVPPAPDRLSARVVGLNYFGHDATVRLQLDGQPGVTLLARAPATRLPDVGQLVGVQVDGPVRAYPPAVIQGG